MPVDPIRRFLDARVTDAWTPGAAWWVESDRGKLSSGAVGAAAILPRNEPLCETTPFDLASLTKPLATALLFVLLEQEGQLDAEAPLQAHLDELGTSAFGASTLLDLAAHTSGLPAWRPLYLDASSIEGYLSQIACLPPAHERGRVLYSDLGYLVLGAVIERVTGESLDALFRKRIADTLDLRRTGYAVDPWTFHDAAATERGNAYERRMAGDAGLRHHFRTEVFRGVVHDGNAHALGGVAGHAGLFGPAPEVARLAREILHPSRLPLGPSARRRLLEVVPPRRGRTVGWVTAACSSAARGVLPDDAPGHTGFTGTSIWVDPPTSRIFVLLTNRVHPEVPDRNFQLLRRGFHRLACHLAADNS